MKKFPVGKEAFRAITGDLNRSLEYLCLLEAAKSDPFSSTATRDAFTLAAVVTYCRPFTKLRRRDGKKRASMPKDLINDLSPDFQELQKKMRIDRNQMWSHPD